MGVDKTNCASCEAGKGPMHGALAQHLAVDSVVGGCGDGTDHVRGVNVLDVDVLQSSQLLFGDCVYTLCMTA